MKIKKSEFIGCEEEATCEVLEKDTGKMADDKFVTYDFYIKQTNCHREFVKLRTRSILTVSILSLVFSLAALVTAVFLLK